LARVCIDFRLHPWNAWLLTLLICICYKAANYHVGNFCVLKRMWREIMKKLLMTAGMFLCLVLAGHTFAQTSNATLGGTVSDATGALIPGVTITATNTATGSVNTALTNEAGAYQFAS